MARYIYHCDKCNRSEEVKRDIKDFKSTIICKNCDGDMRLSYGNNPPAVIFRGQGFYITDSRTE
jgi:putative FmdB family regulatory protein